MTLPRTSMLLTLAALMASIETKPKWDGVSFG
jgi:hypothetical protein